MKNYYVLSNGRVKRENNTVTIENAEEQEPEGEIGPASKQAGVPDDAAVEAALDAAVEMGPETAMMNGAEEEVDPFDSHILFEETPGPLEDFRNTLTGLAALIETQAA